MTDNSKENLSQQTAAAGQGAKDHVLVVKTEEDEEDFYKIAPKSYSIPTPPNGSKTAVHVYHDDDDNNDKNSPLETVLMLHGCGGKKEEWQQGKLAPRLATRYRIVIFDWYGHGESDDVAEYTTLVYLQQLQGVIDEFCCTQRKFHLYAFSMGNYLALHYVRQHPERIQRLVLHSPWNAELGIFGPERIIKGFSSMPLVGKCIANLLRKTSFPHVHTPEIFQQILTTLGQGQAEWETLLDECVDAMVEATTTTSTTITDSNYSNEADNDKSNENIDKTNQDNKTSNCFQVLIICGKGERPFQRLAKEIYHKMKPSGNNTVHFIKHPTAGHMTWHDQVDLSAGSFFRNHIFDFLTSATTIRTTTTEDDSKE
eukprot:scaffold34625_cov172-Amphora_coffeaeformis.AAC.3